MAWTTDLEEAEWFARRLRDTWKLGPAAVYSATVAPDNVLATLHGRGESEVVVDPAGLEEIRTVERERRALLTICQQVVSLRRHQWPR